MENTDGKKISDNVASFFVFAHHIFEFFLGKFPIPVFVVSCKNSLNLKSYEYENLYQDRDHFSPASELTS